MQILHGNNIELLKTLPDNSVDSVVTDPPYGLAFMNKKWDYDVPSVELWKEVYRVLKHGGHVLSFGGTRTYHRMVVNMEDAGFEIRDQIMWLYGCLSDDTEILTRSGYIQYHKFIKLPNFEQQEILIYDTENDIYKWEKPERWNEYNIHKDTCYRIKSDSTDQIVSRNHRCLVEREGKIIFIQAELLSKMEYVPTLSNHFYSVQESQILQSSMQRILSGSRVEEMGKDCFGNIQLATEQNKERQYRREEPILERGNNLSEKERILFGGEVEICEMPEGFYSNGEERRICGGVSISNGEAVGKTFIEDGVCTPHRPQSYEQRHIQLDAICNEQKTQAIRMGRSYSTTLATITPIEYSGIIFCPSVSTGAFVARRNGKVFLTGNSGFPKSHNIGKAIDKIQGNERKNVGVGKAGKGFNKIKGFGNNVNLGGDANSTWETTKGDSEWEGWGSHLKPANEPICLARKPLSEKSIAENVLKHGTGGINIDGCRVELHDGDDSRLGGNGSWKTDKSAKNVYSGGYSGIEVESSNLGRFPANVILDEEAGKLLDEQSGIIKTGDIKPYEQKNTDSYSGSMPQIRDVNFKGDKGGASRFFYCAKASKSDRGDGNNHPTVKPTELMRYLCRLITPPNGIILDPFMGSGSTGKGAILEGFDFIGMELDAEYVEIAKARIEKAQKEHEQNQAQQKLF